MSAVVFLSDITGSDGFIELDRLTSELRITKTELALVAGLSRDAVWKVARLRAPATQSRLREVTEILARVCGWAGSGQHALAWYRSQPLPPFGDQTAESLVKEGRADTVRGYLDRIAVGGYA